MSGVHEFGRLRTIMNTTPIKAPPRAATSTLRARLEGADFKAQLAKALPKHLTPERQVRVACTAIMRTPKLADCEQVSFFNCLLALSQFGLEPDGRRAHLIPFENRKRGVIECQLIIDYKGLAELAMRSGLVSYLHADVVREGDAFTYSKGELKEHTPHFLRRDSDKPADAGAVIAAYAIAKMKDGGEKCEVMAVAEIESIRARSRAGQAGPWVTDWAEMAKKTAFRRLSKWLPLSPEFRDATEADEDELASMRVAAVESDAPDIFAAPESAPAAIQDTDHPPGLEPAPAPAAQEGPAAKTVKEVRALLAAADIPEQRAVAFMHAVLGVHESLGTLEQVAEVQHSYLREMAETWAVILPNLKSWKGGK